MLKGFGPLVLSMLLLAGCSFVQPASATRPITAGSLDKAMKAAVAAATSTNWIPKTVSTETGYLLAEREIRVLGRAERPDSYKLEVNVPSDGNGNISAKVTPPPGVATVGGESTENMVAKFLDAYEAALRR
jgi:hypothetical protein